MNADREFWIWRGQVYAQEWLAKNPEASQARFEYDGRIIVKYRISDEPTRELVMQGWKSVGAERYQETK